MKLYIYTLLFFSCKLSKLWIEFNGNQLGSSYKTERHEFIKADNQ